MAETEAQQYDLIVLGGGPGGYVAAERAGSLGMRVLLVEKAELGGVCLNRGCIPTKTLLHSSKLYAQAMEGRRFGVVASNVEFHLSEAMAWKQKVVETLRAGVASTMKKNNVQVATGTASFVDASTISVAPAAPAGDLAANGRAESQAANGRRDAGAAAAKAGTSRTAAGSGAAVANGGTAAGSDAAVANGATAASGGGAGTSPARADKTIFSAPSIIIATGSSPAIPPIPGIDGDAVVTSTELLEIKTLPKRLVIIGGGYIGMEFASFFSAVGTEVTVVEMMDEIVPILDPDFASLLRKSIKSVRYELGARVDAIEGGRVRFTRPAGAGPGAAEHGSVEGDLVLVSVGRRPNTGGLGLEALGMDVSRTGIRVNDYMETNVPGIYAIGDVTGKSLLAHSASRMGEIAVHRLVSRQRSHVPENGRPVLRPRVSQERMSYNDVPWVVFTSPEVAGCGLTERQASESGLRVRSETISMKASGRYFAEHADEGGICKIVVDEDDRILGVQMLGSGTGELIFGAAMMIRAGDRIQDIRRVVFPHPTASEVLREATWSFT